MPRSAPTRPWSRHRRWWITADERARRTVLEERDRIARELHDIVAHHLSVISIQAQVAPHLVDDPPEVVPDDDHGDAAGAVWASFKRRHARLSCRQKSINRHHGKIGALGERAVATLKTWKIAAKQRHRTQEQFDASTSGPR